MVVILTLPRMLAIRLHRHRERNPQFNPGAFPVPRWLAEFEDAFAILKPPNYGRRAHAPQFRVELRRIMRVDRDRRRWNNLRDDFWHRVAARKVSGQMW